MFAADLHFRSRRPSLTPLMLLAMATPSLWAQKPAPACSPDNGGLTLPKGFCALLVAEGLASPRHLAVAPNGDIFVALNRGGVKVLRDTTGDGKADVVANFYEGPGGSGIALSSDAVYFAPNDRVLRLPWKPGDLASSGPAETIATGLPTDGHSSKGIVLGRNGALFVSFGSLTNSCLPPGIDRTRTRQPGPNPCTELEHRAGVWRFDARKKDQTPADATRWATGLRNPMALSLQPGTGMLFAGVHGRDGLGDQWGYSAEENAENPAETVFALSEGTDGGWPYCYFDSRKKIRLQNPEYGGDGTKVGDCDSRMMLPAISFPGHWAPDATMFYNGTQFPAAYRGGMFIAFHGSWNRAPLPQEGYRVVFAPFQNGKPAGSFETFAAPTGNPLSIRPSGLAVGPDGSLYIGADSQGKIWRVMYRP